MAHAALTFDDGPSQWTAAILDVLAEHGGHATFFVVGETAAARPELLQRIVDEGHEIGNHTWSHPSLTRDCDDDRVHEELARTNELLAERLGAAPRLYRAPHFDVDERVDAIAQRLGLTHVPADVNPPDWHERWSAALTIAFVQNLARPDAILCLHDGVPPRERDGASRQATADAVAAFVPTLAARGIECVTAGALLAERHA